VWKQRIHPDDASGILSGIGQALAGDAEYWSGEYRFLCDDGTCAYVLHRGHVIRDPFGRPVRMIGGMTDLTERRRTEQRVVEQAALLTAESEKHRILFDRAADGIAIVTDGGCVVDANSRFLAMLQATSDTIPGSHVWDWDTAFADQAEWNRLGRSVTQAPLLQTRIRCRDGTMFDAEVVWSAADLPDGRMLYCNVRDISDRKRTEQELALHRSHLEHLVRERTSALEEVNRRLQISEERYAYAADATSDGIWDCDLRTGETNYSPSYFSMLGYTPDGFASHMNTWLDLLHPDDRAPVFAAGMKRLEDSGSYEAEFRLRSKDDSYRWILSRGKVVEWLVDGKPARVVGTHTDLTNRKRVEAELREARDEAEAANRAKSAFLAMMSHEIRTPLNGVIGMAEVLAQDHLQQRQADAVRIIRDLALNLMTLIDDILDFSKIEAGSLGLDRTSVSISELIEDICASLAPLAQAKGVELSAVVAPDCPEWLLADPTRLRQILFNVAGNAIKFSGGQAAKRGRVTIRVDVAQAAPLRLRIQVADNGIGMTAETQSRLYSPFTQGETSTTRRYGGTGLGLAITRRLIDLFQGTIEVDSAPGVGTTFTMILPFEIVADRPAPVRPDLSGVNCVLAWSAGIPDAADLQGYLASAGACTYLAMDLTGAMTLARTLTGAVVVIHNTDPGQTPFRSEAYEPGLVTVQQLLLWREQRWRAYLDSRDHTGLDLGDLGWMRQDALLRAVAIAAGRMPQDALATNNLPATPFRTKPPPTVVEARAQGRLILLADDDEINRTVILRQLNLLGYAAETASDGQEALEKWRIGHYALLLTDIFMPNVDGYQLTASIRQQEAGAQRIPIVLLRQLLSKVLKL
jgi:PAS domain S-box-containing protein